MVVTEIVTGRIEPFPEARGRDDTGAELVFNGRVRGTEGGRSIRALEYEYYPEMAETELRDLAEETVRKYPVQDLYCRHRVGTIPVGSVAIHVVIRARHRKEALDALGWFIDELKQRVPIWKRPVWAEVGE
jgi:molybdopterin synthase catalytic subunit